MAEKKPKEDALPETGQAEDKARPAAKEPTPESPPADKPVSPEAPSEPSPAPEASQPEKSPPPAPSEEPSLPAPEVPEGKHYFWGTGRRKKAVARVRIRAGSGKFFVNKNELDQYFKHEKDRQLVVAPLQTVKMVKSWDIWVNVRGGGFTGQAGAVTLGLARALAKAAPELEGALRGSALLTRDSRMKERKKYGQKGARKRFQFSKR